LWREIVEPGAFMEEEDDVSFVVTYSAPRTTIDPALGLMVVRVGRNIEEDSKGEEVVKAAGFMSRCFTRIRLLVSHTATCAKDVWGVPLTVCKMERLLPNSPLPGRPMPMLL
jgi:hypothetical protein